MSDNFGYCKVGTVITLWEEVEKSLMLLSQYWTTKKITMQRYLFDNLGAPIIFLPTIFTIINTQNINK